MPTYKVNVTEVRHVECSYWVDVQIEVGDELEEARRLAENGETVHEKVYGYSVAEGGRTVSGSPKLDDLTPLEHLECQAHGIEEGTLDDVVHDILAEKAGGINNGGKAEQLRFLLEELGEEEAIRVVNGAKEQAERDRNDVPPLDEE